MKREKARRRCEEFETLFPLPKEDDETLLSHEQKEKIENEALQLRKS